MSKGKEHKKYEFGAKASVVAGKNGGVILGAYSLPENDYDGHALEPTLEQVDRVAGYRPGWLAMGLTSAPPGRRSLGLGGHTWKRKENRQRLRETQGQKEVPPTGGDRTTERAPQERLSTGSQLPQRPSRRCHQPATGLAASNLSLWMRQVLLRLVWALRLFQQKWQALNTYSQREGFFRAD